MLTQKRDKRVNMATVIQIIKVNLNFVNSAVKVVLISLRNLIIN